MTVITFFRILWCIVRCHRFMTLIDDREAVTVCATCMERRNAKRRG